MADGFTVRSARYRHPDGDRGTRTRVIEHLVLAQDVPGRFRHFHRDGLPDGAEETREYLGIVAGQERRRKSLCGIYTADLGGHYFPGPPDRVRSRLGGMVDDA